MLRFWLIRQSRIPFSIHTLLFFSLFVGIMRGVLEHILFGIEARATDVLAFIPFYLSLPFFYALFLGFIPGMRYNKILQPVTFATLLGLTPPLFDFFLGTQETHSVFYGYFVTRELSEFPWLGYNPDRNYPPGEAVTIWLTFLFAALYCRAMTRSTVKAALALMAGYAVYLVYSLAIPAFAMLLLFGDVPTQNELSGRSFAEKRQIVYAIALVQIFIPWLIDATKSGVLKQYTIRILHFAPFLTGTILGTIQSQANLRDSIMAALVTITSGFIVTAHNDFQHGLKPSVKEGIYRHGMLANFFAIASYTMILFAGYKFALLGIACFALSVLYHYPFYNARNTAFGSMKIEGFWGMLTYLTGAMAGAVQWPDMEIISFAFVFWGGFSIFSIIKDAKDIRIDYTEGRNTVYTYLYRKKIPISRFQKYLNFFLLILILVPGLLFFQTPLSLLFHITLSLVTALTGLKSYKKNIFYFFLISIIFHLIHLIYYYV